MFSFWESSTRCAIGEENSCGGEASHEGAPANAGTATRKGPAACSGGQKRCNGADLRKARKPEVQSREPEFLGNRVLCQYGGLQHCNSTEIRLRTRKSESNDGLSRNEYKDPFKSGKQSNNQGFNKVQAGVILALTCFSAFQAAPGRASCHPSQGMARLCGAEMRQKNLYIAIHAVNRQFVLKTPRAAPEKL